MQFCIWQRSRWSPALNAANDSATAVWHPGIIFNVLMVCCGGIFWGDRHDAETMEDDGIMGFILACCGCGSGGSFFT